MLAMAAKKEVANVDPDILTQGERKDFKTAIERRQQSMLNALNVQISTDVDSIIESLRSQRGLQYTEDQLREMIQGCDEQIKEVVGQHISAQRAQINAQKTVVDDEFDEQEQAMRNRHYQEKNEMDSRHRQERDALRENRSKKAHEFDEQLVSIEEKIGKEMAGPMVAKREEYRTMLVAAKEVEAQIYNEAQTKHNRVSQCRRQLETLITDAGGRALEELIITTSRTKATELLNSIPTVQEALEMINTQDGLSSLMGRLGGRPLLAMGSQQSPAMSLAQAVDNQAQQQTRRVAATVVTVVGQPVGEAEVVQVGE
jgi:hypothetical protein